MNRKLLIVLIGCAVMVGCRPRGILSSKQMEDIFVDLHTAEGIMQEAGYNYGYDEQVRAYYLVILQQHGISQEQFDSSLVWYTANPTIFDKIYPKVINRLQANYDRYKQRLAESDREPKYSAEEWVKLCQRGYDFDLLQKKTEKIDQKFAQVENLL